jgi:zinc protease
MGNYVLGGGALASRLADRVRQTEGLSYGVSSGLTSHPLDARTSLTLFAIANPKNRDKLMATIREEIDKLVQSGVTAEELERAKKGYLESQQVNRANDRSLVQTLSNSLFAKRTLAFQADLESKIANLTVDDVNDAVRQYIQPDRLIIATAGDFQAKQPSSPK